MSDLRVRARDTLSYDFTVKKADGTPQPLGGATLRFMAKRRRADPDNLAAITASSPASGLVITDAPNGKASLSVSVALDGPSAYFWELQMTDSLGAVKTLEGGRLIVLPDVIRAT